MNSIYVFGHKNPDTDAVTASIALSYLKNKLKMNTKPVILDHINKETEFVLDYFDIKKPEYLEDVKLQIKDVNYHKDCYIDYKKSIYDAYKYILERNITGVPVVDENKKFITLLTLKMISTELVQGNFDFINTSYDNLLRVLKGTEILKLDEEIKGYVMIPSYNKSNIQSSIVIVRSLRELRDINIDKIKLVIITENYEIDNLIMKDCLNKKISIIKTHYDLLQTIKLINLASYIKTLLNDSRNISFNENDYYEDFKKKSSLLGYNNYPVINDDGICLGLIRITDINEFDRKKVILVDHNDINQSVDGLDEAEILEIVDHHNLGTLITSMPVNFRSMTVGSTNTIIYSMFSENNIEIPRNIAGIMLSGILSDTLKLTSPTTTEFDKTVANSLAQISGIDIDTFATKMFEAGSNLKGKSLDQIIRSDLKIYETNGKKFIISQVITLSPMEILNKKEQIRIVLNNIKEISSSEVVLFCVTDIVKKGSYLFFNESSSRFIASMFGFENIEEGYFFEKCLSRKKQLVPLLMNVVKNNKISYFD